MSANFGSGGNSQEVDLNITPIIDCFTVLITFMLASASFLSIGFLETSTPGTNMDATAAEPDTEALVRVKNNHQVEFKLKGKKNLLLHFDANNAENMKSLSGEIQKLKAERLHVSQVLLSADDDVDYKSIADVMGHLNNTPDESKIPVVMGDF